MLLKFRVFPLNRLLKNPLLFTTLQQSFSTSTLIPEASESKIRVQFADAPEAPKLSKRQAKKRRQLLMRMQIYPATGDTVSDFMRQKYEKDARRYWDLFYKRNENRFFKDRHYLHKEWGHLLGSAAADIAPDVTADISGQFDSSSLKTQSSDADVKRTGAVLLREGESADSVIPAKLRTSSRGEKRLAGTSSNGDKRVVLEVGCGAGNTVYPLLEEDPAAFIHACDFSPRAVDLVEAHPSYDPQRVHAFVCDITEDDLRQEVPSQTVDIVSMIFVLSAISPEKMPAALLNVASVLKLGGHVLLRDYADGDLAQERLTGKVQKLADNFYVRGDGTRAYYFTEEALLTLFRGAGLECTDVRVHERELENRARKVVMNRRWIQGTFQKVTETAAPHLPPINGLSHQLKTCTIGSSGSLPAKMLNTVPPSVEPHASNQLKKPLQNGRRFDVTSRTEAFDGLEERTVLDGIVGTSTGNKSAPNFSEAAQTGVGRDSRGAEPSVQTEWESGTENENGMGGADAPEDDGGPSLGELFSTPLEYELRELTVAGRTFRYRALSREHQHTQPSTGLLLWNSACVLAEFLAAHPQIVAGRHVLEVGCGGIALPSILSADQTAGVVATDGDAAAMNLLDANLALNSDVFEPSKLHAERLRWGNSDDIARVRRLGGPHGYDVIIGADVVYVSEAVPLLFQTAAALLADEPPPATPPDTDVMLTPPVMLLCHVIRRVAEDDILEAARRAGFQYHRSIDFGKGGVDSGAIRLLALRRAI